MLGTVRKVAAVASAGASFICLLLISETWILYDKQAPDESFLLYIYVYIYDSS